MRGVVDEAGLKKIQSGVNSTVVKSLTRTCPMDQAEHERPKRGNKTSKFGTRSKRKNGAGFKVKDTAK